MLVTKGFRNFLTTSSSEKQTAVNRHQHMQHTFAVKTTLAPAWEKAASSRSSAAEQVHRGRRRRNKLAVMRRVSPVQLVLPAPPLSICHPGCFQVQLLFLESRESETYETPRSETSGT
uniref:Uncharacterized protein n=1 Tax=Mastacembelus armatus TaxID=205130 RepID=A0A7N8XMG7_9TELE